MKKPYLRRDSATAWLRNLGIPPTDYNTYLVKVGDTWELDQGAAQAAIAPKAEPAEPVEDGGKPLNTTKDNMPRATVGKPPKSSLNGNSISGVTRAMIMAGKTNAEIMAVLKENFGVDESKKHYPSWYRAELRRNGYLVSSSREAAKRGRS